MHIRNVFIQKIVKSVPNSNNRPTREPGVIPDPAEGERLLLPVPQDSRSSQSHSRHSRGIRVVILPAPMVFPRDFTAPTPVQNSTGELKMVATTSESLM